MSKPRHHHAQIPKFHSEGGKVGRRRGVHNHTMPNLETVSKLLDVESWHILGKWFAVLKIRQHEKDLSLWSGE